MPNWCENTIKVQGSKEDVKKLHDLIGDDFDFNKIIPMPHEMEASTLGQTGCRIKVVCDSETNTCHLADGKHGDKSPIEAIMGGDGITSMTEAVIDGYALCEECLLKDVVLDFPLEESIERFKAYGTDNWYDWRIANWGTKWGSSDVSLNWGDEFMQGYLKTAWSPPEVIYRQLVELFPDLSISWHYNEPVCNFSGDFETATHNNFADPCECGCDDCYDCNPEITEIPDN